MTRTGQGLLFHEELLPRSLPLLLRHDRWFVHREMLFRLLIVRRHFHFSLLFRFVPTSSDPFFLRETFTANAARPPAETAPATTNPMVAKQNGHIVYLLRGQLSVKLPPLVSRVGSTNFDRENYTLYSHLWPNIPQSRLLRQTND